MATNHKERLQKIMNELEEIRNDPNFFDNGFSFFIAYLEQTKTGTRTDTVHGYYNSDIPLILNELLEDTIFEDILTDNFPEIKGGINLRPNNDN